MKLIVSFLLLIFLVSCKQQRTDCSSEKQRHEPYDTIQPVDEISYTLWLKTTDVPDDVWIMVGDRNDKLKINTAVRDLLRKLGYADARLEEFPGAAMADTNGVMGTNGRRKEQTVVTTLCGKEEKVVINASVESLYLHAEDPEIAHLYNGPFVSAGKDSLNRRFRLSTPLRQQHGFYSHTGYIGLKIGVRVGGRTARKIMYIRGVVALKPDQLLDMRFESSLAE